MNKTVNYPCVFVDETGTAKDDPFFGVGLLKVDNPYQMSVALQHPQTRAKSVLADRRLRLKKQILSDGRYISPDELNVLMVSTRHAEYHFTDIHPSNLDHYMALLEAVAPFNFHFCALMVDKRNPHFDLEIYKNPWDYYVSLVRLLCKKNITVNEKAFVIADYMTKPRISKKDLDEELFLLDGKVANVQLVDSVGMSLIQLCDLMLGAVAFQNRVNAHYIGVSNKSRAKSQFVARLATLVGCPSPADFLENKTFSHAGKYFSIWHLEMHKNNKGMDTPNRVPRP